MLSFANLPPATATWECTCAWGGFGGGGIVGRWGGRVNVLGDSGGGETPKKITQKN